MAKYYITSGNLKEIVISDEPKQACIIAFKRYIKNKPNIEDSRFGIITTVSETGSSIASIEMVIETWTIIEALGLEQHYKKNDNKLESFLASKRGQIISHLAQAEASLYFALEQLDEHDLAEKLILTMNNIRDFTELISTINDNILDEKAVDPPDMPDMPDIEPI